MGNPIAAVRRSIDRRGTKGIYALLMVQQVLSSGTHIVAKMITHSMDALTLTLTRSIISALAMTLILALRGSFPKIAREDRALVLLLSFLAIPINQFFFLYGMHYTIPSNAALLYATTPILVLLFSWVFLGERLTRWKILGVVIGFIGVVIVIFERGFTASMQYVWGNLLMGIAVLAWGLYTVLGKRLIVRYGAVQASAVTLILGTFMFVPIGLLPMVEFPFGNLSGADWAQILYLGLITSVFSYFLWYFALARIEAGKAALFSNFQPVLTTIMTVMLLGQDITPAFILGGTIALAGVVIAQFG